MIRAFTQKIMPNLDSKITQWTLMFLEELDQECFDRNVGQAYMTLEKGFLPTYCLDAEWDEKNGRTIKDEQLIERTSNEEEGPREARPERHDKTAGKDAEDIVQAVSGSPDFRSVGKDINMSELVKNISNRFQSKHDDEKETNSSNLLGRFAYPKA